MHNHHRVLGPTDVLTGELAIPIGIHLAWNFFEGPVYGFAVSGTSSDASPLHLEQGGPKLWIGGAFGAEAGLLCTISCTFALGLVAFWIGARRGKLSFDTALALYTPRVRSQHLPSDELHALPEATAEAILREAPAASHSSVDAPPLGPPAIR